MDAVAALYPCALQYVWNGVNGFTVPSFHKPRSTAADWDVVSPSCACSRQKPIGVVRFFLCPERAVVDLNWVQNNINFCGALYMDVGQTWGFMNCRNTSAELLTIGALISSDSNVPYSDVVMPTSA